MSTQKGSWLNLSLFLVFLVLVALFMAIVNPVEQDMLHRVFTWVALISALFGSLILWTGGQKYGNEFPKQTGIWPSNQTALTLIFLTGTIYNASIVTESPYDIFWFILTAIATINFAYLDHKQLMSAKKK